MPASKDESVWGAAAVRCVSQGENSLNFTCSTVPTEDISVYVNISQTAYQLDVTWDTSKEYPFGDITPAEMRAKIEAASADDLSVHIADKNNPHGVTAAQIGAATAEDLKSYLPLTGGAMTGAIINKNTSQGIVWSSDALELKALDTSKKTSATARIHENGVFGVELKNSADDFGGHFRVLHGNGYDGVYYNSDAARFDDDHRLAQQSYVDNAVKYRTNPNLLDNWFFGRPVNQRNGYIVPAGVDYYTFAWEKVGQTDKNYQVLLRRNAENNYDCEIEINGTRYVVGGANSVPGYCDGYSYTIDRWKTEGNIVVTFESDGISIENVGDEAGQFMQELPPDFSPEGTLLCISAIVKSASGDARLLLSQSNSPWGHTVDFIPLQAGLYSGSGNLMSDNHKFSIYLGAGAKIKLTAVKLELGDTQTLAHQDSSGNWILNEIPDFEEQLSRCEFYRRMSTSGHYFSGAMYSDSNGVFLFPFSGGMRVTPSIEIVLPGAIIDSNRARHDLSTDNYSIESVDRFGVKIVLHGLSGIPVGPACICDAKFALSADL